MPSIDRRPLERARSRFQGKHATVVGLAREGLDLVRFLTRCGARVRVTDTKSAAELAASIAALANTTLDYSLGSHDDPAILEADVMFVSPGVPPEVPLLREARRRGVRLSSLVELFFDLCPGRIVGITGSAGKTTVTALLGDILRQEGRDVFVGGNIGHPLLGDLERMTPRSWAVLELSSFQLETLHASPHVATITNVTPNHLDRHPSMESYWEAKGNILNHQCAEDWAVLNADDAWSRRYPARGRGLQFSLRQQVDGAYLDGADLCLLGRALISRNHVPLAGEHNVANVLAAMASAHAAGVSADSMVEAIRHFKGVPHRLQVVAERDGVVFVDDSIATTPERSMAAIRAFDRPAVLIAGGRDKHLPMDDWAQLIVSRVRHVVLLGEMGPLVRAAILRADPGYRGFSAAHTMDETVEQAARFARPGDVVLLAPGGTSFDGYQDFTQRGLDFQRAVAACLEVPVSGATRCEKHPPVTAAGKRPDMIP